MNLYLNEFKQNLQWYLDNLDYSDGWTWFHEDGTAMSNCEVAAMTTEEKAQAFIDGRYTKSSSGGKGGMMGDKPDGIMPGGGPGGAATGGDKVITNENVKTDGDAMIVGTPDAGTTQSANSTSDSANYSTYEDMVEAYEADIAEIQAGNKYGNNIVYLYNPLNYIDAESTENPTWVRILMGASEGDMSMFSSLNLQIAWLNAGVDADIEWQWDGGHVPSEILGDSFSLYVDQMYGEHVQGAFSVSKPKATVQTENGTAEEATGTNLSSWVSYGDGIASFSLAGAVAYRTAGASKATPGFDVIDYGQEDYVFGSSEKDARHWDTYLLDILKTYEDELKPLFN